MRPDGLAIVYFIFLIFKKHFFRLFQSFVTNNLSAVAETDTQIRQSTRARRPPARLIETMADGRSQGWQRPLQVPPSHRAPPQPSAVATLNNCVQKLCKLMGLDANGAAPTSVPQELNQAWTADSLLDVSKRMRSCVMDASFISVCAVCAQLREKSEVDLNGALHVQFYHLI